MIALCPQSITTLSSSSLTYVGGNHHNPLHHHYQHDHHDRHHHHQHDHYDQVMLLLNQLALTGEKKMNLKEWLAMIGLEKKKNKKGKNDWSELLSHDELSPPSYRNDWSQLHHHQNHNRGVTGKYNRSFKLWLLWYTQAISVTLAGRELSLGRTLINSVRRISGERNCSGR